MVLDVKYMALTNGTRTIFCMKRDDGRIALLDTPPTYMQMLGIEELPAK